MFLGTRNSAGVFEWKTYEECYNLAAALGSGIVRRHLAPELNEWKDYSMKFVGIFSKNREEYLILDMACCLYGIVTIPIYETFGLQAVEYIFSQTNMTTVFCSKSGFESMIKIGKKVGSVANLVCLDSQTPEQLEQAAKLGYSTPKYQEIFDSDILPLEPLNPENIMTFSYTSGTTGNPKGVMLSYANIISVAYCLDYTDIHLTASDSHLSYLPLAHILERIVVWAFLNKGGSIGFYSGDVQKLKEDLTILKPTIFVSVPRLFNRFFDLIKGQLNKITGLKKILVERAIASKLHYLRTGAYYKNRVYDMLVFNKIKQAFGGNVKLMVTGSAPISAEVLEFLRIAACCPIIEGYGQTESTGASFCTQVNDPTCGHIGGPTANTEFKILDVAEMSYTSKDKDENGNPLPRGELCLKGYGVFKGYYKDDEKTKEAIDEKGWLHTGDIVQLNANGSVKIIDRKKNIFKLAQGEYVAAEKIEICYAKSEAVEEIFVYGDSLQAFLVGVVLPKRNFVLQAAKKIGLEGTFEELIKSKEIKQAILTCMNAQGKSEKLAGFEFVRRLHLISNSFAEQGLITSTFKLKRHEAKNFYINELNALYAEPEEKKE